MAAPKAKLPILLCWPMMSEADVGGMAVEAGTSCPYSTTFCCYAADDRREAI